MIPHSNFRQQSETLWFSPRTSSIHYSTDLPRARRQSQGARRRGVPNFFSPLGALAAPQSPSPLLWEGARAYKRTRCRKAHKAGPFEGKNKSERSSENRTRGRKRERAGERKREKERVRVTQMRILSSYAVILSKCSRNCGPLASRDADYSETAVFTSGFARPAGPRKVITRWSVFYGVYGEQASALRAHHRKETMSVL